MTIGEKFERLVEIMAQLRSETGCMWDRRQTHASLRQYLLEEAYEVLETIDQEDHVELGKELGDLLLQIVFHAQIAKEAGAFDVAHVIENISEKMIRRHPHVFGEEKIDTISELKTRWEEIKKQEGKPSAGDGVPRALPALQRAARLQQKAGAPALRWEQCRNVMQDFEAALEKNDRASGAHMHKNLFNAFGDLLFALVAAGRSFELNAEDALREACERFAQAMPSNAR
jgi:tetrapyrrole methylase family protein/MazG family protein